MTLHYLSRSIKVVEADKTGIVTDGPDAGRDIDYQLEQSMVTYHFDGFESTLHGLVSHEVAIGRRPKFDDILPYSTANVLVEDIHGIGNTVLFWL